MERNNLEVKHNLIRLARGKFVLSPSFYHDYAASSYQDDPARKSRSTSLRVRSELAFQFKKVFFPTTLFEWHHHF